MSRITQAMILAAGKGTRLRPMTLTTPKPLVEVAGQPLIVWHIKALKSVGITDITINCSWLADKLMAYLGDGSQLGVQLHWSVENEEPLETAGGIAQALHTGKLKKAPFILINSDIWTTFDFGQLLEHQMVIQRPMSSDSKTHNQPILAHVLMINNPKHNPTGDFAIDNGLAIIPKSDNHISHTNQQQTYTFSGISIISPQLLEEVQAGQVAPLAPYLKQAMQNQQVTASLLTDHWIDVGTLERLKQVNDFIQIQGTNGHLGRP